MVIVPFTLFYQAWQAPVASFGHPFRAASPGVVMD